MSLLLSRVGIPQTVPFDRQGIRLVDGHSFSAEIAVSAELADTNEAPRRSLLRLFEDGVPLGPAHSMHATIAVAGRGAFSHWNTVVYFSSSDNSDPRTNSRVYAAEIRRTGGRLNAWLGPLLLLAAVLLGFAGRPTTRAVVWAAYVLFLLALGPGTLLFLRSNELLEKIRASERRFQGVIHRPDPELGVRSIPGSHGVWTYPGNRYEIQYDAAGFRTGGQTLGAEAKRKILFLGCSFTWGDGVEGDETFAMIAGRLVGARTFNAGFPGYGYSQMVVLARRLIPELQPDQVVVQVSPWLVDRSRDLLLPSLYGAVPGPYFSDRRPGALSVEAQKFLAAEEFIQDLRQYQEVPMSLGLRGRFAVRLGMGWVLHDAWGTLRTKVAIWADPRAAPTRATDDQVTERVLAEIRTVAAEHGAPMVILKLSFAAGDRGLSGVSAGPGAVLVDGDAALRTALGSGAEFNRAFMHWDGNPAVLVDSHPNRRAHEVLARALLPSLALQSTEVPPHR